VPGLLKKIIGFKTTIKFFSWDLLLKRQSYYLPRFVRVVLVARYFNSQALYFFRFLENLFFRHPRILLFKYREVKSFYFNIVRRKKLHNVSLTFTKSTMEMYICAYFTLLFLGWGNSVLFLTRHFGPQFVSLYVRDLTSYNVLAIHDYPQDDNWFQPIRVRFLTNFSKGKTKRQYFSLFKIYRKY